MTKKDITILLSIEKAESNGERYTLLTQGIKLYAADMPNISTDRALSQLFDLLELFGIDSNYDGKALDHYEQCIQGRRKELGCQDS